MCDCIHIMILIEYHFMVVQAIKQMQEADNETVKNYIYAQWKLRAMGEISAASWQTDTNAPQILMILEMGMYIYVCLYFIIDVNK